MTYSKKETQQLMEKYHQLSPLHQRIMQIKAVLYHVVGKTDFMQCMVKSELRAANGKKLHPAQLNPLLDDLCKHDLLDGKFNCNPCILHKLTSIALSQDNWLFRNSRGFV